MPAWSPHGNHAGPQSPTPSCLVVADHEADPDVFAHLQVADAAAVGGGAGRHKVAVQAARLVAEPDTPRLHGSGSTVRIGTPSRAATVGTRPPWTTTEKATTTTMTAYSRDASGTPAVRPSTRKATISARLARAPWNRSISPL